MGFVASAVSSAVSWVGDAVESVVDFAVDEILEPVIDMASGVVKGMLDDPLTTIATIAAVATGNAWAVPLINGASTAIQGGDIGDIALAVAASYVGSKVGPIVGDFVGAEVGSSVGSEAVGRIAGEAAAGAARGVITAAATGGDIGRAALMGLGVPLFQKLGLTYEKVWKLVRQKLPLMALGMDLLMLGWSTLKAATL